MMSTSTKTVNKCFHCGDICRSNFVKFEDKQFCCDGCLTVHQILSSNGLENYYDLEQYPGVRKKRSTARFEFLDEEAIASKLYEFEDEKHGKFTFTLPDIHCSSCVWLLENLNKLNPGVKHSRVNFFKKEATVVFEKDKISFRKVAELLDEIGYTPSLTLNSLESDKPITNQKALIKRLAVAGFCFGNVMLFSFPEYFGLNPVNDLYFIKIFGGFNLLFGTLALLYSGFYYLESAFKSLRKKVLHINVPLALGMLTLFLRTAYEILAGIGPGYADSLTGLIFFLLIGKWFQDKTYGSLSFERDYKSYFPVAVRVMTDDGVVSKSLSDLQKGDRLQIRNEEIIPVDGILLNGSAAVDYSFVTGESVPVNKQLGELLYAGGKQLGSQIELEATKEVSQSQLTKIWNELGQDTGSTQTQAFSDRIAKYFTITLIGIALLTLGFWLLVNPSTAIFAFTSVLIVACPCALALSSPFALGNAMRLLGRKEYYLKNSAVVEELSHIDHLVFDKTGTITVNDGYALHYKGQKLSHSELEDIRGVVSHSKHPYSEAIYTELKDHNSSTVEHFKEIAGKGLESFVNEKYYRLGSEAWIKKPDHDEAAVWVEINGEVKGRFVVNNRFREELGPVLKELDRKKYKISVLSGDQATEKKNLDNIYPNFFYQLFKQTPEDKLNRVKELQEGGDNVMMLGDGLNDAGALLQSDVGLVITSDSNNFTPAAKAIVDENVFGLLPNVLTYSKTVMKLIKFSFVLSLIYNIAGLFFAIQGLLSPVIAAILMPLSSITVVAFNTVATRWAANKHLNTPLSVDQNK